MSTSLTRLQSFYRDFTTPLLLHAMVRQEFPENIAVVTHFGAEAGVLLSFVAALSPQIPILYIETDATAPETLLYGKMLERHLGLKNMQRIKTDAGNESSVLSAYVEERGILALITGNRRSASDRHADMHIIELDENGVFILNPLAYWTQQAIENTVALQNLPPAPFPLNDAITSPAQNARYEIAAPSDGGADWSV